MRSSLIEPRPAPNADTSRGTWSTPAFQRIPPPPPPAVRQRSRPSLVPNEGWLPLLLLAIAVYSVVYSVTAAITISHTTTLWITTAIGLLCGLIVSKSRFFPQAVLHIGACLGGFWVALMLTSTLTYQTSPLVLLANLHAVIQGGFVLASTQNSDMVFLFYLSFLCFFLGYFGSWLIYRAHLPWLVALVYVSIMIVNLNYIAKSDLSFLVVILVGALILLIARIHLANQLTQWKSDGLYTDQVWLRGMTTRFLRIATLFLLLTLPFSWLLPVLSQPSAGVVFWNNLDNAWANLTHGHLSSLSNPGSLFNPYQPASNFFGDQLTITGSVNLPNGPVLSYTSSSATQGQYLEGFTFDQFDGHTWTSLVASSNQSYGANVSLPQDTSSQSYNKQIQTAVTIIQPPGGTKPYIFAPLQPYSFTVPVTLISDNSNTFTSAWTQASPLTANERYEVTSNISTATPSDLAQILLPDSDPRFWINDNNYEPLTQHYLQTPGTLSHEVLDTARLWTSGAKNTYEAVAALQARLSNQAEFLYSVTNDPVPTNIDVVTWLLHTHKGYCTYYSTAMAVMARLLHIPARIVNGFSQGQYDNQKKLWVVNGNDAHSWVQIYFPNYGWINFDPTPGFSNATQAHPGNVPTARPTHPTLSPSPTTSVGKRQTSQNQTVQTTHNGNASSPSAQDMFGANILIIAALLILLSSLFILGMAIVRYRASRSPHSPVAAVYARLCRIASLVGSPPAAWQTPYEYTFALSRRFPEASTALRRIADLFVRERWAAPQQMPAPSEERALTHLWPRLRNTLLRSPFKKGH